MDEDHHFTGHAFMSKSIALTNVKEQHPVDKDERLSWAKTADFVTCSEDGSLRIWTLDGDASTSIYRLFV